MCGNDCHEMQVDERDIKKKKWQDGYEGVPCGRSEYFLCLCKNSS